MPAKSSFSSSTTNSTLSLTKLVEISKSKFSDEFCTIDPLAIPLCVSSTIGSNECEKSTSPISP